jgi:hypothetical protein
MSPKKIITLFVAVEIAIIVIVLLSEGYSANALQTITRFSGRFSLMLFSAIFLLYNKPDVLTLWLSNKFYLLFAIVHGIHLIELLLYVNIAGVHLIPYRVAGGFLAYAYVFSMPIFQHYRQLDKITSKTYSTIETVFVYYVWLIFFLTYLPRVQGKLPHAGGSFAEHVALLGWVSMLLGVKVAGQIQFSARGKE